MDAAAIVEHRVGTYSVSTDPARIDVDIVHDYLHDQAYWSLGRPRAVVERSLAHSALVGGVYGPDGSMVGFGRMVTDLATFAWLCDVFVLDEHKGHGLGIALVRTLVEHPDVVGIKRQLLATADAHDLYRRFGFDELRDPARCMVRQGPGS